MIKTDLFVHSMLVTDEASKIGDDMVKTAGGVEVDFGLQFAIGGNEGVFTREVTILAVMDQVISDALMDELPLFDS
jgi:hypothetical protein